MGNFDRRRTAEWEASVVLNIFNTQTGTITCVAQIGEHGRCEAELLEASEDRGWEHLESLPQYAYDEFRRPRKLELIALCLSCPRHTRALDVASKVAEWEACIFVHNRVEDGQWRARHEVGFGQRRLQNIRAPVARRAAPATAFLEKEKQRRRRLQATAWTDDDNALFRLDLNDDDDDDDAPSDPEPEEPDDPGPASSSEPSESLRKDSTVDADSHPWRSNPVCLVSMSNKAFQNAHWIFEGEPDTVPDAKSPERQPERHAAEPRRRTRHDSSTADTNTTPPSPPPEPQPPAVTEARRQDRRKRAEEARTCHERRERGEATARRKRFQRARRPASLPRELCTASRAVYEEGWAAMAALDASCSPERLRRTLPLPVMEDRRARHVPDVAEGFEADVGEFLRSLLVEGGGGGGEGESLHRRLKVEARRWHEDGISKRFPWCRWHPQIMEVINRVMQVVNELRAEEPCW